MKEKQLEKIVKDFEQIKKAIVKMTSPGWNEAYNISDYRAAEHAAGRIIAAKIIAGHYVKEIPDDQS